MPRSSTSSSSKPLSTNSRAWLSALATALQRLHKLPARPDAGQTAELMRAFAPHRSLATMHLWNSLKDPA